MVLVLETVADKVETMEELISMVVAIDSRGSCR